MSSTATGLQLLMLLSSKAVMDWPLRPRDSEALMLHDEFSTAWQGRAVAGHQA